MAKKENIKKLERSLAPVRELIVYSFRFVIGRRICTTDRETGDQTPLPGTLVFLSTSLFPYNCNLICFFFLCFLHVCGMRLPCRSWSATPNYRLDLKGVETAGCDGNAKRRRELKTRCAERIEVAKLCQRSGNVNSVAGVWRHSQRRIGIK
jgi:hypothetical protein